MLVSGKRTLRTASDYLIEQLRLGTIQVRDTIGDQVSLTDGEIQDSLWHYYYDIDKTVNYLLSEQHRFWLQGSHGKNY